MVVAVASLPPFSFSSFDSSTFPPASAADAVAVAVDGVLLSSLAPLAVVVGVCVSAAADGVVVDLVVSVVDAVAAAASPSGLASALALLFTPALLLASIVADACLHRERRHTQRGGGKSLARMPSIRA